ncbi:lactococcin 972 family bacteriocin [Agreia sp. VKM Ac-1783]|uniref:lactococcin 972 family bacteriocin n=1 Tax=Agreia sp. VKM Ac-1783 TaxID=1938889 RepID=UPI000A2AD26E|nr:lactococcin 972 family bacteriocin [Agreia sp. VKM Ac-1783]SMQ71906.1 bacteriocin, lactococcin 972 family [Agreia sp. VKM Ac-1783]
MKFENASSHEAVAVGTSRNVTRSRKKVIGAMFGIVVAAGMVMGGALSASATTSNPEGGSWNYGVRSGGIYGSGGQVYSEYQHNSRPHKATACNGAGTCEYSGWKVAGLLAAAYQSPATDSGNKAYYDVS